MKIRRATAADIPHLVALNEPLQNQHADAYPTRFRRDVPRELVAQAFTAMLAVPSSYWLVAEAAQPIGFLSAEFRHREETWCQRGHQVCYLAEIVVAPEHRRQGIARMLLDELKREVQSRGITAIDLEVWAFNAEAKEAFMDLGFTALMEKMTLAVGK
jgi:ribosomal protein S18 acetylase RimI-like enzyme